MAWEVYELTRMKGNDRWRRRSTGEAGIAAGLRGVEDDGVALVASQFDSIDEEEEGGEAELWEALGHARGGRVRRRRRD